MIININGVIEVGVLDLLVNCYNSLPEGEKLKIMFSSEGGDNAIASAIVYLINCHASSTEIVGYGNLISNGFRIFFAVNCQKDILPQTLAMYHVSRFHGLTLYEGTSRHNIEFENFISSSLKNYEYIHETHELVGFTDEELADMKQNKDVWFKPSRLKQMLKYNKKYLGL